MRESKLTKQEVEDVRCLLEFIREKADQINKMYTDESQYVLTGNMWWAFDRLIKWLYGYFPDGVRLVSKGCGFSKSGPILEVHNQNGVYEYHLSELVGSGRCSLPDLSQHIGLPIETIDALRWLCKWIWEDAVKSAIENGRGRKDDRKQIKIRRFLGQSSIHQIPNCVSSITKTVPNIRRLRPDAGYVYLLFESGECVYVGKTKNIHSRMASHDGEKSFDDVWYVETTLDRMDVLEAFFINRLNPRDNKTAPQVSEWHCNAMVDEELRSILPDWYSMLKKAESLQGSDPEESRGIANRLIESLHVLPNNDHRKTIERRAKGVISVTSLVAQ